MRVESTKGRWPKPLEALRYQGFRVFWLSMILLSLGIWVVNVAQMWLVQELTGSPFYLGLVNFFWSIPILSFSLVGGVVADRVDRVKLIMVSRGLHLLLTLGLALIVTAHKAQAWHVLVYALLSGLVMAFDVTARMALFPTLVYQDDLMNAVALVSMVWSSTNVIGPALAGLLIGILGTGGCFYLAVLLYAITIWGFSKIPPSPVQQTSDDATASPWQSLFGGLVYIRRHPVILPLLILTLLPTVLGQSYVSLLPAFAADILRGDAGTYGSLLSAAGVGAVLGALILATLGDFKGKGAALIGSGLVFGIMLMVFAFSSFLPIALVVQGVIGLVSMAFMTISSTLVQGHVTDDVRGRVMSVYMLTWGLMAFGSLMMGVLGNIFGVGNAIAIGGSLTVLSIIAATIKAPVLKTVS